MLNFAKKKDPPALSTRQAGGRWEKQINLEKVKLPFNERLAIVESLGIMLSSGIPIIDAFSSIEEDSSAKNTKQVVKIIIESIQKGQTLAESFSQFPNIFDDIFINTVKAGEESGSLDKVLKDLTDSMKRAEGIKNDVRSAMIYPAIVLVVLFFVLVVLMGFVVPRIAEIFEKLNIPKPLPTQILLSTSTIFSQYFIFIMVVLFLAALILTVLISKKEIRKKMFTTSFRVPIVGSILRFLDLARFSGTLSLLLSSGIPVIRAVETSSSVVINQKTHQELTTITHKLTEGKNLSESMREYKTFPTLMTRIISTGEKTGNLDKVLAEVSSHYHSKMKNQVKVLSTSIEPILIVIIGVIVGLAILAIVSPIYQLIGQINPR